jgi:hypothetical protein
VSPVRALFSSSCFTFPPVTTIVVRGESIVQEL